MNDNDLVLMCDYQGLKAGTILPKNYKLGIDSGYHVFIVIINKITYKPLRENCMFVGTLKERIKSAKQIYEKFNNVFEAYKKALPST